MPYSASCWPVGRASEGGSGRMALSPSAVSGEVGRSSRTLKVGRSKRFFRCRLRYTRDGAPRPDTARENFSGGALFRLESAAHTRRTGMASSGLQSEVTGILRDWSGGDARAPERLMPFVYDELRRLARAFLARERGGHTLQPTALVNEAYLRLVDQTRVEWQNRAHFYGIASRMMRRVLIDHARAHATEKRGGAAIHLSVDDLQIPVEQRAAGLLAL